MADQTTKERLVSAGTKIFAEKGYRDATVAEICEKAEANIAAVNYHFGDKESLYDACWRHAFSITATTFPIDGGLPENPSIEDSIYCYASAILHRIFSEDDAGLFPLLLAREMVSPTLALEKIATDALLPQSGFLKQALIPYLGEEANEEMVMGCMLGVISQCAFFNFNRGLRETVIFKKTMTEEELDQMARHIARFSIGGIDQIKKDSGK
jgi:AcrR family transcriptional regulator